MLRNGEVDVHGPDGLERHDRRPGVQILAEVDLPDPEHAGKRRADRLALRSSPGSAPASASACLYSAIEPVEVRLGLRCPARPGPSRDPEFSSESSICGLRGRELSLLLPRVEPHEHGARRDRLTRLELDLLDDPGQVRADRHALDRGDRADRVPGGRPLLVLGDDGRHRLRRRLKRRLLLHPGLDLPRLDGRDRGDEDPRPRRASESSAFSSEKTSVASSRHPGLSPAKIDFGVGRGKIENSGPASLSMAASNPATRPGGQNSYTTQCDTQGTVAEIQRFHTDHGPSGPRRDRPGRPSGRTPCRRGPAEAGTPSGSGSG